MVSRFLYGLNIRFSQKIRKVFIYGFCEWIPASIPILSYKRFTLPVKKTTLIWHSTYTISWLIFPSACGFLRHGLLWVSRIVVEISACPLPTWEVCLRTKTLRILWLLRVHYSNNCSIQTYLILRNLRSWSKWKTSIVKTLNTKILKESPSNLEIFIFTCEIVSGI